MPMSTGTVSNLNDLYDAFITFCLANGWTLNETITTRDKVLKSVGTDLKQSMYYRHTANTEAGFPYKFNGAPEKGFPHFITRGYQYWNAGSGLNEFGQHGPWLHIGELAAGTGGTRLVQLPKPGVDAEPVINTLARTPLTQDHTATPTQTSFNYLPLWDGVRRITDHNRSGSNYPVWRDLWTAEPRYSTYAVGPAVPGIINAAPCVVWDATTDTPVFYLLQNTATLAQQFVKCDTRTGTYTALAAPPWAASVPQGGALTWDGADTIYALHGNNTTEFAKYTISTNTWTSLAATPVARSSTFANPTSSGLPGGLVFAPNTVTAIGENVRYAFLAASGTTIYRYDITSNVWRTTSGTGALTCPFTITLNTGMAWDNMRHLYLWAPNSAVNAWYRSDLAVAPNTFTNVGTYAAAVFNQMGYHLQEFACGRARASAVLVTKYWFIGDADGVSIVTRINGNYYWSYFGLYASKYRSEVMTTTGAVSAGSKVTVAVESSAGYAGGERVLIFDPTTNKVEFTYIASVPNATSVVVTRLVHNYTTGSRLGTDPSRQIITGGSGMAVTLHDARGFRSEPAPAYYVSPDLERIPSGVFPNGALNAREAIELQPMNIKNVYEGLATFEELGTLNRVFSVPYAAYPSPQPESLLNIGGQQYLG